MKNQKSFTFIETLIVVGIIALLTTAVVVVVNPAKRFEDARDKQREIHLQTIYSAIERKETLEGGWFGENCPVFPEELDAENSPIFKTIGTGERESNPDDYYDLFFCLVPKYMVNPLYDPDGGTEANTKYQIWQNPQTKYVTLRYVKEDGSEIVAGAKKYGISRVPTVVTADIDERTITHRSAEGGGDVTNNGGSHVFERGVIWGKAEDKERLNFDYVNMDTIFRSSDGGEDIGHFNSHIYGLIADTEYCVCAYARNEIGVGYCDEPDKPDEPKCFRTLNLAPAVRTESAESVTNNTAVIRGTILTIEVSPVTVYFCWAREDEDNPGEAPFGKDFEDCPPGGWINVKTGITTEPYPFSVTLESLDNETTYYFKACGQDGGSRCDEAVSFFTQVGVPYILTLDVDPTDITAYSALVGGDVKSNGGAAILERGVCFGGVSENPCDYNPLDNPNKCEWETGEWWETGNFFVTIGNLDPGKKYNICAYARNEEGPSHGEPLKLFQTNKTAPEVETVEVISRNPSSADVKGKVGRDGGAAVTKRGVCWSTGDPQILDPKTNTTSCTNDGPGPENTDFISHIPTSTAGLWANTNYYVRAYAINEIEKTGWGGKLTLGMVDAADPTLTTIDARDKGMTSATLGGNITDHGGAKIKSSLGILRVCWSKSTDSTDPKIGGQGVDCPQILPIQSNLGEFTTIVGNLLPYTDYSFQAYAKNEAGLDAYGGAKFFRTLEAKPLIVTTNQVEGSGLDWAMISGNVSDGYSGTKRGICYYDPDYNYSCTLYSDGTGSFEVKLGAEPEEKLQIGEEYTAFAFAYNVGGETEYGNSIVFELAFCKEWVSGEHLNIPDETDPRDECNEEWTSCDGLCKKIGKPGYCYGGVCRDLITKPIDSGYICTSTGMSTQVSATTYCNTQDVCTAGSCSGKKYYTSCDGVGSCRPASDHTDSTYTDIFAQPYKVLTLTCGNQDSTASIKCANTVCIRNPGNCSGTKKYPECQAGGVCDSSANTYYSSETVTAVVNRTLTASCENSTDMKTCGVCKWCQGDGQCLNKFYDDRVGAQKTYDTVSISDYQCWMKQNMDLGSRIEGGTYQGTSCSSISAIKKYCYENSNPFCTTNHPNYPDGGLYQWGQAMCGSTTEGSQGICPAGWRIPRLTEVENLFIYAGVCKNLPPNGSSGFEGNYSGFWYDGSINEFRERDWQTYFWTSTSYPPYYTTRAYLFRLYNYYGTIYCRTPDELMQRGASVRCITDPTW